MQSTDCFVPHNDEQLLIIHAQRDNAKATAAAFYHRRNVVAGSTFQFAGYVHSAAVFALRSNGAGSNFIIRKKAFYSGGCLRFGHAFHFVAVGQLYINAVVEIFYKLGCIAAFQSVYHVIFAALCEGK